MTNDRTRNGQRDTGWSTLSLSEEMSHREHDAALEATLFQRPNRDDELVLELEAGRLRLQDTLS